MAIKSFARSLYRTIQPMNMGWVLSTNSHDKKHAFRLQLEFTDYSTWGESGAEACTRLQLPVECFLLVNFCVFVGLLGFICYLVCRINRSFELTGSVLFVHIRNPDGAMERTHWILKIYSRTPQLYPVSIVAWTVCMYWGPQLVYLLVLCVIWSAGGVLMVPWKKTQWVLKI